MHPARPPSPRSDTAAPWPAQASVFVGMFLALLTALLVFATSSTDLLRFPDRAIGVGLMRGVDPSRRISIYLLMVALPLGVWLGCHYAGRALKRRVPGWFSGVRSRMEHDLCATLCAVGSVALIARVAVDRLDGLGPVYLCLAGLFSVTGLALARRLASPGGRLRRELGAWSTLATALFLAWPSAHITGALCNLKGPADRGWVLLGAALMPAGYALALFCRLRWRGRATPAQVRQGFAVGAAPFFAFPAVCPFANELQYTLAQRHSFDPRGIALAFLGALALLATLAFWLAESGRLRFPPGRVLARFCFPAMVFGTALIAVYEHQLVNKSVHPLHDGEQITAVYQLLTFDKWPFVDVWPAHGLFDYLGALYSTLNGFRPFELTAYNGILAALGATAAYAVIARVSTPFFALAVATLLPVEAIFPLPQYSFFYAEPALLAIGLLTCWVLHRPSLPRYASLVLAFLCFFWTPTSGVACIVSVFALLTLSSVTASDRKAAARGLGVFALSGVGVFVLYVLVLLMCHRPVLDTLRLVQAFMRADPLIGGRPSVLEEFDALAFFQYLVLPGIGMLYLGKLARHALERRPLDRVECLLGFLTLASFVLFARTLTRHGIIERYQPFFFPFLALGLLMPRRAPRFVFDADTSDARLRPEPGRHFAERALGRTWFCVAFALYLVLFPVASTDRLTLDPFEFHAWKPNEPRFVSKPPAYSTLGAFLHATLRPNETFLELLNMPLLYALFERELPGQFFLPTMFYATDKVQHSSLERLRAFGGSERVPVVLLPGPKGSGNRDNINNTFRSYRIAEHVYRDYVPFTTIDGFDVWVSRARWDEAAQGVSPLPLAFREPDAYETHSLKPPRRDGDALWLASNGPDPRISNVLRLDSVMLGGLASHHGVRFLYRTNASGTLELFFRYANRKFSAADSGQLAVRPTLGEWRAGQVSIPPQPRRGLELTDLRIDPPDESELEIKALELVYGEPPPGRPTSDAAGMLPFFWGNFDARLGQAEGTVLEHLEVPEGGRPLSAAALTLRGQHDKSSGNYLRLCLRIAEPSVEPGARLGRWQTVKHGGSWQSAGKVTLRYGATPVSTFELELVRPDPTAPGLPEPLVRSFERECKRYLVRLSAQYAWTNQPVSQIDLHSSVPIVLEAADLLAGD